MAKVLKDALTAKGVLKTVVRNAIREQVADKFLGDFIHTPKGSYVIEIANADGTPVYAKIDLSISTADNLFDEPKPRAKAGKEDEAPEVSIFD